MIIDGHIHRYPSEVISDPVGWGRRVQEPYWVSLVTGNPRGVSIQGWAERDQVLRDMDAAGVSKAVLLGWYWERQATCEIQNQWHLDWIREKGDRFIGFSTVQPRGGERAYDDLRRSIESGLRGIGEINPVVQGFGMNDPVWMKILGWAQENGIPVTLHATEPVGHSYPGKAASRLADFVWLAKEFPELRIILAHWGGGLPFYELNPSCRRALKNVLYDTAASPLLYDGRVFRCVADVVGAEKIVFGSDYPLRVYPREEGLGLQRFVEAVRSSGLNQRELKKVFSGNISRLLSGDVTSLCERRHSFSKLVEE